MKTSRSCCIDTLSEQHNGATGTRCEEHERDDASNNGSKRRSMDQLSDLFKEMEKSSRQRSLSDGDGNSEGGKSFVVNRFTRSYRILFNVSIFLQQNRSRIC